MDIYYDTSFRSILEDDYISLAFKAHIHSYSNEEIGLWLVARSSIHLFCITHSTFTSTLCFCLGLI